MELAVTTMHGCSLLRVHKDTKLLELTGGLVYLKKMLAKILYGRRATEVVEEYKRKLVQSINTMGPAQPPWVHQKHIHRALFWPEPEPEPHNISHWLKKPDMGQKFKPKI